MSIKWNEYTWYSRLAAFIFFIAILPAWTFYIGTQYQTAVDASLLETIVKPSSDEYISDQKILDTIVESGSSRFNQNKDGIYELAVSPKKDDGFTQFKINLIAKGDIDGDGLNDAFLFVRSCGATCGSGFYVIINKKGHVGDKFEMDPEGIEKFGAGADLVKQVNIDKGVINIKIESYSLEGSVSSSTLRYRFVKNVSGTLLKI